MRFARERFPPSHSFAISVVGDYRRFLDRNPEMASLQTSQKTVEVGLCLVTLGGLRKRYSRCVRHRLPIQPVNATRRQILFCMGLEGLRLANPVKQIADTHP